MESLSKNIEKANTNSDVLASRLNKINEIFGISEELSIKMDVSVSELYSDIEKSVSSEKSDESSDKDDLEIITIKTLKEDFNTIRDVLLGNIDNGKDIINKLSQCLVTDESSTTGAMISSYAELIGVVNNSLKLLTDTYKNIVDIHIKITTANEENKKKSLPRVPGNPEGTSVTFIQNNVTVSDIIRKTSKEMADNNLTNVPTISEKEVIEIAEVIFI